MITNLAELPGMGELWAETLGDPRIRIAVLDGPVDRGHPCFDGVELSGLETRLSDAVHGGRMSAHGTHVASVIFGQPGSPVHGIAPESSGLLAVIYSDRNQGPTSQRDLAQAIHQAVQAGAQVVNISGGELSNTGQADPMLAEAVRHCRDKGVLIVAAAGNDACRCLHVPAALPSVLAVGAMDEWGRPLDSSNWGDVYQSQGVLAPGHNILGALPGGGTALRSGTSYAAPVVTGIVALLLSEQLARGENPDPLAVGSAILASATPCNEQLAADCRRFLAGRLNVPGARALISKKRRNAMSNERTAADSFPINAANQLGPSNDGAVTLQHAVDAAAVQPSESVDSGAQPSGGHVEANGQKATATQPNSSSEVRAPYFQATRAPRHGGMSSPVKPSSVLASDCACKANNSKRYVFAIGSLNYDFGTEARRDSFRERMPPITPDGLPYLEPYPPPDQTPPAGTYFPANPYDARQMVNYLAGFPTPKHPFPTQGGFPTLPSFPRDYPTPTPTDPEVPPFPESPPLFPPPLIPMPDGYRGFPAQITEATELIWTLNIELTPVYAIRPDGNFSTEVYQRLVEFLAGQVRPLDDKHYVARVSIPGYLTGETVQLFSGQVVPVLVPYLRGMYAWNERQLILQVLQRFGLTVDSATGKTAGSQVRNFLRRVYYELRNLGQSSQERALNYAATNAFQAASIIVALAQKFPSEDDQHPVPTFELQSITVERSPFCRIDSDCWDVYLKFFFPDSILKARDLYSYTIDVSDPYPVSIGELRQWSVPN
jgi:hypothetical protein